MKIQRFEDIIAWQRAEYWAVSFILNFLEIKILGLKIKFNDQKKLSTFDF
ncbi:MAG: hypothetical protein N3F62_09690 [Bacteroidia bacterium]|nr:hypothetical protein [Bacteroidia bacterium]